MADVQRMQFTDLDSYQRIWRWMGECGDTHQQAGEVIFSTPNMGWPGQVARPGDWIVRTPHGFVAEPAEKSALTAAEARADEVQRKLEGAEAVIRGIAQYHPNWPRLLRLPPYWTTPKE